MTTGNVVLTTMTRVSVGASHVCAVQNSGASWCWGNNAAYQLGRQSPTTSAVALQVPGISDALDIQVSSAFTCLRAVGDTLRCFGANGTAGMLGRGTTTNRESTPSAVIDSSGTAIQASTLSTENSHSCSVLSQHGFVGRAVCWGYNSDGRLGVGDIDDRARAAPVTELDVVSDIDVGYSHTCAIVEGAPYCWGGNDTRQLGVGDAELRLVPSAVLLP